jgi:hypothetical protein
MADPYMRSTQAFAPRQWVVKEATQNVESAKRKLRLIVDVKSPFHQLRALSVIAFREKAGRSQVSSFCFSLDKVFLAL